jgi:hypothetical protein
MACQVFWSKKGLESGPLACDCYEGTAVIPGSNYRIADQLPRTRTFDDRGPFISVAIHMIYSKPSCRRGRLQNQLRSSEWSRSYSYLTRSDALKMCV